MLQHEDISIYDNILTLEEIKEIQNHILGNTFPWYISSESTVTDYKKSNDYDKNTVEYMQFVHQFYDKNGEINSDSHALVDFILTKFLDSNNLKLKKCLRAKVNCQTRIASTDKLQYNTPHIDHLDPHWVLLYYVCNSDGDTRIFSRKIYDPKTPYEIISSITPKEGRFVLFNGAHYHSGVHPSVAEKRVVINYNITLE